MLTHYYSLQDLVTFTVFSNKSIASTYSCMANLKLQFIFALVMQVGGVRIRFGRDVFSPLK